MEKHKRRRSTRAAHNLSRRERRLETAPLERAIPPGLPRLYRIDEIAQLGGPKRAKLYQHVKSGLLPTVKIGTLRRVTEGGYLQYLEALAAQSTTA